MSSTAQHGKGQFRAPASASGSADWQPLPESLAPQALQNAYTLPAEFYTAAESGRYERSLVFGDSWQLVARAEQLRQVGDHVTGQLAGVPIVVVRDEQHQLRAFHNVCRHRAGPLETCPGTALRALRCRYHGWTYTLSGQLRSAPEMQAVEDFSPAQVRLPEVRLARWHQLIFASLQPAVELAEVIAGIDERIGQRNLAGYRFQRRVSYEIPCNWKVYVDNFLEGYHLPHIHPGLNRLVDYRSYRVEAGRWHSLQWSPLETQVSFYGAGDAFYYYLYPNTMLNLLPGRMQTNRVVPLAIGRCRVDFDYYYGSPAADESEITQQHEQDQAFSDEIQQEDIDICVAVQNNLTSGSYCAGRLNPKREDGVHHFHELIRAAYRRGLAT